MRDMMMRLRLGRACAWSVCGSSRTRGRPREKRGKVDNGLATQNCGEPGRPARAPTKEAAGRRCSLPDRPPGVSWSRFSSEERQPWISLRGSSLAGRCRRRSAPVAGRRTVSSPPPTVRYRALSSASAAAARRRGTEPHLRNTLFRRGDAPPSSPVAQERSFAAGRRA